MEAAFLESGTNVDKVRGDVVGFVGFGCFALLALTTTTIGGQNLKC